MYFVGNSILRAPDADTDSGAGGGSGDTAGFSEAQLKYLGGVFNQVVTSHLKRQPTVADQLKDFKWEDVLAPMVQKLVPVPEPKPEPGSGKKADLSEYERQLAKLTTDFQNSEKARIDAENKARNSEQARRNDAGKLKLRSALTGHITDGALDHVINHLTLVSNRLVVDEDGNTRIRVKRPEFPGAPPIDMEVPIEDSIKDILSESDMKIFIPAPKGSGGSNPGPGGKGGTHSSQFTGEAKTDAEKVNRALTREREIKQRLGIE